VVVFSGLGVLVIAVYLVGRFLRGFLGRRYLYFCPHCRKVLGVSHRKGFWMG
jgi:hypothetical protein